MVASKGYEGISSINGVRGVILETNPDIFMALTN